MKILSFFLFLSSCISQICRVGAFIQPTIKVQRSSSFLNYSGSYGPQDTTNYGASNGPTQDQVDQFRQLFNSVVSCTDGNQLPSIMSPNVNVLLELSGGAGLALLNEELAKAQATGDPQYIQAAESAVDYIIYFVETFVTEAKRVDDENKELLGSILKCMVENSSEEQLDSLILEKKGQFNAGFLRHLDGECMRITNAPSMTPESTKMLQILRMIQARIIEELGQDLGERAQILGQLLGYETTEERLAVLDAGLQVRGKDFAMELKEFTTEALEGFKTVPGGVEPKLMQIVTEIDSRIDQYLV
jgi:hypothetical protein